MNTVTNKPTKTPIKRNRPFRILKPLDPSKIAEKLTELGASNKEIAELYGVKENQFYVWQRALPDLKKAVEKGRLRADERVIDSLFNLALRGNVTAQIFWLKNRQPNEWNDRRELFGKITVENQSPDELDRASDAELRKILGTGGLCLLRDQPAENGNGHPDRKTVPAKNNNGDDSSETDPW